MKIKYAMRIIWVVMVVIGLGSSSVIAAVAPLGLDIENLPEWEVTKNSLGGKLLLSDSPEMVTSNGVLYQDKVEGKVRLFFYHVNASSIPKKLDVVLENKGHEDVHIHVNRSSLGGPGHAWLAVGKETLTSYLAAKDSYQLTISPGQVVPLSASISEKAVLPNMLINGIFDFVADRSINVKVMMLSMFEDSVRFSQTARILPADETHLRGTFEGADRQLSPVAAYDPDHDGPVGLTLADNKVDSYLEGIDAIDGTKVINYGNYGVVYQIMLPSKNKGKIAYYLAPMGGYYAGAIAINHPDVRWSPMATPIGSTYFGTNVEEDCAFLGTYDSGDRLSFTFSPPGASNLPVKIVILPQ